MITTAAFTRTGDYVLRLTARNGQFVAMLVKRTPFTEAEQERVSSWAERSPFFALSASPNIDAGRANVYQAFLALDEPSLEARFVLAYPFDVRPVDDDRPFFFKYSLWNHLFTKDPMLRGSVPVMEYTVLLLLLTSGCAALLCVYLPLRWLYRREGRAPHASRYGLFFASTGLGYMAVEIALLQKFGLFLGHPNYALSVVLSALLLATGLGSLFSAPIVSALGQLRYVTYVLAAIVLGEYALARPRLSSMVGLPLWVRVALVFALVMPIGVCLGTFFPSALGRLHSDAGAFVPWAWGINGMFSVIGPILSVGFSMTWGINALLLSALPVYLVAGFALPGADGQTPPSTPS